MIKVGVPTAVRLAAYDNIKSALVLRGLLTAPTALVKFFVVRV